MTKTPQLAINNKYPAAVLVRHAINATLRMFDTMPKVGKARPLAKAETATTWRELTMGDETFRVLTIEDSK